MNDQCGARCPDLPRGVVEPSVSALPPIADVFSAPSAVWTAPTASSAPSTTSSASCDQRGWYGEAEGLGDLEVGYEIKFGGMHDRQVGWLFAFEDTVFIFPPRIQ